MTGSKLIDSSVWIEYLTNGSFKETLESNEIFLLSVLSLFEIKKILTKQGRDIGKISKGISFIKKKSLFINIDAEISEMAVDFSTKHKIPTIDSLIYISALKNNATLITLDNDFRGLDGVTVLD